MPLILLLLVVMLLAWPLGVAAQPQPLALTPAESAWLEAHPRLVAGAASDRNAPFRTFTAQGFDSLGADVLKEIAKRLGVETEVKTYATRRQLEQAMASGEIDIELFVPTAGTLDHDARLSRPYLHLAPLLILGPSLARSTNPSSLDGLRVTVREGGFRQQYLRRYYPSAIAVPTRNDTEALRKVASGEADAYISTRFSAADTLANSGFTGMLRLGRELDGPPIEISFAVVATDGPLLGIIDRVLASFDQETKNRLIGPWIGLRTRIEQTQLTLTPRARDYLKHQLPPRVGIVDDEFPLGVIDERGLPGGYSVSMLDALLARLDMSATYFPRASQLEVWKQLEEKKVDLAVLRVSRGANLPHYVKSKSLISLPIMLATRRQQPTLSGIESLAGLRLAGDTSAVWFNELLGRVPSIEAFDYEKLQSALAALDAGQVDAVAWNLVELDAAIRRDFGGRLKIAAPTNLYEDLLILGQPDMAPMISLIERALTTMPLERRVSIENRWFRASYTGSTTVDWLSLLTYFGVPIAILSTIAIMLGLSRRRLRREIKRRRAADRQLLVIKRNLPAIVYKLVWTEGRGLSVPFWLGDTKRIFGVELEETREPFSDFLQRIWALDVQRLERLIGLASRRKRSLHFELALVDEAGHARRVATYLVPRQVSRQQVHWNGYWIDTTTQYQQSTALREAKESAEHAARMMSSFTAAISHEIRTPMSAIIGSLELLEHQRLASSQHELVSMISEASEAMLQILDDVLDLFKLGANRMSLHPVPLDLRHLIENSLGILRTRIHAKNLALSIDIDPRLAFLIEGDPLRLRQILFNLVSNATKFTQHGGITVSVRVLQDEGDTQQLRLAVIDTGIGIAEDQIATLFTPFRQAEDARARYLGGTGLGLALCRDLVEMMGGKIDIQSKLDVGTRVEVALSLPIVERYASDALSPPDRPVVDTPQPELAPSCAEAVRPGGDAPASLLVVEDNDIVRALVVKQLHQLGHGCEEARDGEEALERVAQHTFDLVFTDCHMPRIDGFTLCRQLKSPQSSSTPPFVIGMTANLLDGQLQRCHEAGMDDVITKPTRLKTLANQLEKWLCREAPTTVETGTTFDMESLIELMGDGEGLTLFVDTMIDDFDTALIQAGTLLENADRRGLAAWVHRQSSTLQFLGDSALRDEAQRLDRQFQSTGTLATQSTYAEFIERFRDCRNVLVAWREAR